MFPLLRFIDKYVKHNWNSDVLANWKRNNRQKTLVHKISYKDLALVTLVYETKMEIWAEDMEEKEKGTVVRQAAAKYHLKKGARCRKNTDGWTEEGRAYFKELCASFKRAWKDTNFKDSLIDHWRAYEAEHHRKSYKRKASAVEEPAAPVEVNREDYLMDSDDDDVPPPLPSVDDGEGITPV